MKEERKGKRKFLCHYHRLCYGLQGRIAGAVKDAKDL